MMMKMKRKPFLKDGGARKKNTTVMFVPSTKCGILNKPRDGVYIGETSRSLNECAVEHVRDADSFSHKSHIVKHWMASHPKLNIHHQWSSR